MKENQLVKKLFEDLFNGDPWLDVNISGTLKDISAAKALKKINAVPNSIWEIVNHLISWRNNVLQRVQGKELITPSNNYFEPVEDISQKAWEKTLRRLEESQNQWRSFLQEIDPAIFSKVYLKNKMNYREHIHGIIQHDAYHLGQIVLLAKYS